MHNKNEESLCYHLRGDKDVRSLLIFRPPKTVLRGIVCGNARGQPGWCEEENEDNDTDFAAMLGNCWPAHDDR